MTRRPLAVAVLVPVAVTVALVIALWHPTDPEPPTTARSSTSTTPSPTLPPIPIPGHEVYGFVPYWEMDDGIVAHVGQTDLTTLAVFSVTHRKDGSLASTENGYKRITGQVGRALIAVAHDRGIRVDLVYTSFGTAKNAAFYGDPDAQARTIAELTALVADLGVDGINVDVEQLDAEHIPAYGAFVGRLRAALRERDEHALVSVATTANVSGSAMALAASLSGADRIFMMGYDYRVSGSEPGASAPLGRRDGSQKTLAWSLDLYRDIGVPADRTILGLPLYGMSWPVLGPEVGAAASGKGSVWVPRQNLDTLADPSATPAYDATEDVEVLVVPEGDAWRAIYYDTAASLRPKLALADDRGLAGAGFWAIGYERGLADYTKLIATFRAGEILSETGSREPGASTP